MSFYEGSSKDAPSYLDHQMSQDLLSSLPEVIDSLVERVTSNLPIKVPRETISSAALLAWLALESASLLRHRATISERVFGLKRSARSRALLLLLLIESPAFLALLQKHSTFNTITSSYTTLSTLYRLLFLLRISPYFSPVSHLLSCCLVRSHSPIPSDSFFWLIQIVQGIQWAHDRIPKLLPKLPAAPAPPSLPLSGRKKFPGSVNIAVDPSLCAICCRPRTNPTALRSGWVFCYRCVTEWQEKWGSGLCPVSGEEVGDEKRRLYY